MFKKVLIPIDVAVPEEARKLLNVAKSLTKEWACDCHVVTVIPTVGMPIVGSYFDSDFQDESESKGAEELSKLVSAVGIDAQEHVLSGKVYDSVIALATKLDTDLIVLGAHQPELSDYLLGSNAARVVRHSRQSVLVVRDA